MGERRALLIGVRNDHFGRLDFVPEVIRDLRTVVLDDRYGSCRPALPDGREFLTESEATTRAKIVEALDDAMASAGREQATLFVYFLGHGHKEGEDFYLVASDTPGPDQIHSQNAIPLGQWIKELLRLYPGVDGLMLVIDACHSGAVISDPVPGLLRQGLQGRVEFFAATRPEEVASRGCFSRSLAELLKKGSPHTADAQLRAYDEHCRLREVAPVDCADLAPTTHMSLNGSCDAGLWLGRNSAADVRPALAGTQMAGLVARLTRNWQVRPGPAADVMRLLAAGTSPIAITGGPGTGKSALLASFGRRSAGEYLGLGLDALVTARLGENLADLAEALLEQLDKSPAYRKAAERFQNATPVLELEKQPRFDQVVTGPLTHLEPEDERILVGVDTVEQLGTVQRRRLLEAFTNLHRATLIVTGRQVDDLPQASQVPLPDRDPEGVKQLVRVLVEDPGARDRIVSLSDGEWLWARMLSGLHRAGHFAGTQLHRSLDLAPVFEKAVSAAVATAPQAPVEDVARVLAAAPVGAQMPLQVLVAALRPGDGDGQTLAVRVRDGLAALGELPARADAGSPDERVGPAHELIAEFLRGHFDEDAVADAHSAIVRALRDLQQADPLSKPVAAYVRDRLSEHLWAIGESDEALSALPELPTPADNLALWQSWHERLLQRLGPDYPDTLTTRHSIAAWTGKAGDARAALDLCTALLPDQRRVLGPDHPDTLATRHNIAAWTGQAGDAHAALDLCTALLPDQRQILGPDHPDTLTTRHNLAHWTGLAGDARAALELFTALLPDRERVLGPDHRSTLNTRHNIAFWTGRAGDARAALDLFTALLPDRERIQGSTDPGTLTTRHNIAAWTGDAGDARAALELCTALLPDRRRVLGADHPDTLATRHNIAFWTGRAGDARAALELFTALLHDQERVLGADHPGTLTTRHDIAAWTGRAGDGSAALKLCTALLPDRERVLGPDHPDTLATRHTIVAWTGRAGDARAALELCTALLPDRERVLGPDHPDTLTTRHTIADLTGRAGNIGAALELFTALLPDRQRVLGTDHPDTLASRSYLASAYQAAGRLADAIPLFERTLADRERILGETHLDTLASRSYLASAYQAAGQG
ncbi:MAG TPA: tetratricopeptide repeat protein [Trebonia sp.]